MFRQSRFIWTSANCPVLWAALQMLLSIKLTTSG